MIRLSYYNLRRGPVNRAAGWAGGYTTPLIDLAKLVYLWLRSRLPPPSVASSLNFGDHPDPSTPDPNPNLDPDPNPNPPNPMGIPLPLSVASSRISIPLIVVSSSDARLQVPAVGRLSPHPPSSSSSRSSLSYASHPPGSYSGLHSNASSTS